MRRVDRRGFLRGLLAAGVAAPAIVKITSIMPVKAMPVLGPVEVELDTASLLANCTERYSYSWSDWRAAYAMESGKVRRVNPETGQRPGEASIEQAYREYADMLMTSTQRPPDPPWMRIAQQKVLTMDREVPLTRFLTGLIKPSSTS